MQKDDLVYVGQMLDLAQKAAGKVEGITRDDYDRDENLRLALVHLIQTLGEAARKVSPPFHQAHPEIPWAAIIGMRHRVVHDYLHVDFDIVWGVTAVDLPPLTGKLRALVPGEGG